MENLGEANFVREMAVGKREGFNSREHLRNAELQADQRGYKDILIVDVDAHHYENQYFGDIPPGFYFLYSSNHLVLPIKMIKI